MKIKVRIKHFKIQRCQGNNIVSNLKENDKVGIIRTQGGYTSFENIKMKPTAPGTLPLIIAGTSSDDKIVVIECENVDVRPKEGKDFVLFQKTENGRVYADTKGAGTVFGGGISHYDSTELKSIPGGWEYSPKK